MKSKRKSGILLHISSLPCEYGIGDLGLSADRFVDFLHSSNQSFWQILPINPTDPINEHSPYSSSSAFAGNILFISPQVLVESGLLDKDELNPKAAFSNEQVDFDAVVSYKTHLYDLAYNRFAGDKEIRQNHEIKFSRFIKENAFWLDDYALFATIKSNHGGIVWTDWPEPLRTRDKIALDEFRKENSSEITKVKFHQYIFFTQWSRFKNYCNQKNIKLIGDMAIYMNFDSADVWAHTENYKLDDNFNPTVVAGVPPDYFSDTGQRWGNPIYDWNVLKETNYLWWVERFKLNFKLFDTVRVDHFRGLVQCWEIPASDSTAVNGTWVDVPTEDFLKTLEGIFSKPLNIIAEDLGFITDDVKQVMHEFTIPGMKVLQFAFNGNMEDHPYLPHNYSEQCVAYTGTHDNNTVLGWYEQDASQNERDNLRSYVNREISPQAVNWDFILLAMESKADLAIIPLQDILDLGSEARMNKPATMQGNWRWRYSSDMLNAHLSERLSEVTMKSGRR